MILSRAGQYLYEYERKRYTFRERFAWLFDLFDRRERIILPAEPEHFADVSFYQAGMDWDVYALNARAAIIRLGQNTWPDTSFVTFYNEAKARGIALGGYWFFDGRATPSQQLEVISRQMNGRSLELELFVDWEKNYGGAYEGLPRVVELMQKIEAAGIKCKAVGMYTGYYWFVENSNAAINAAQYTYLKQHPLWLAWYSSASVVKVPPPWVDWLYWQYGTPSLKWGQPTVEIDANYFNGSRAQFEQKYLGGTTPPPEDVTTHPFNGVTSITGTRYGWKFWIDILDPAKVTIEVTHAKTTDKRDAVSAIAKARRAQLAYNGGEWNRGLSPAYPLDYSVSNSNVYQQDSGMFRPSLLIAGDGGAKIAHEYKAGAWQAVTGARYIVQSGASPAYLDGTAAQYTEGHNRTCYGVTADRRVMVMTCNGAYPNQGLTLKQASVLMIQYGAVTAFDGGGGGDTTRVMNGVVTNNPQDGAERRVPEFVLAFTNGGSMVYGLAKEVLGKTGTIRTSPEAVSGNDTGKRVQPFSTIEFVEIVPGKSIPADKWFRLPDGNYLNYILAGRAYYQITREPVPDVPGETTIADMPYTITLGGGTSPYVETIVSGVVKAK